MRKSAAILLLVMVLLLAVTSMASAQPQLPRPVGDCPDDFVLHDAMDHDESDGHHHAGLKVDLNDDGQICVLHVSETRHVHVDNFVRER